MMEDPKEKQQQQEQDMEQPGTDNTQAQEADGSGWDEHQQVDEIGNEIDPDDVK